jgi:ATP-dependent Clp endopeptidase proteolytic subunit ClpP
MADQKFYTIRNSVRAADDAPSSAEVLIYGDIGESWWAETVSAKNFVQEIAALDVDQLTVRINSQGGSVMDGIAIYNALKRHRASVTTINDGLAASIASLILMAGDKVEMAENALMMIHAPWGYAAGNAVELREFAALLDTWSEAMSTSYAAKSGKDKDEMLALLTDGIDHWYTADEALAQGFIDSTSPALALAASLDRAAIAARFKSMPTAGMKPAAAAAQPTKETSMSTKTDPAATPQPAVDEDAIKAAARAEALAQDNQRRTDIKALATGRLSDDEGVTKLLAACADDVKCTVAQASQQLLAHLGSQSTPTAGNYVETVEDEGDKHREAIANALMARGAVKGANGKPIIVGTDNPYRGMSLLDLAHASLERGRIKVKGHDKMKVVGMAFTQSTSDFPILLENVMHKTLQAAYATAPDTWSRFCAIGSVSDFRAHNRYRVGSLGNLDDVGENGEYQNKEIPDGEKSSISAGTKGNIINVTRHMIINDDLGAFLSLAIQQGRAAKRTIEAMVYALLAEGAGLGPTMVDGKTLFHADHGNVGTGAALTMASIEADRVKMAQQKDVSGNDYLDLRPAIWVGPIGLGGTARTINDAQYDPDTANKLQKPNMVRGLYRDIVDTPRLSGTRVYSFADPNEAPVIEVAFLDGVQEPFLESQDGFTVDGTQYKVRLDVGVGAIDYRGAVTNAGQ